MRLAGLFSRLFLTFYLSVHGPVLYAVSVTLDVDAVGADGSVGRRAPAVAASRFWARAALSRVRRCANFSGLSSDAVLYLGLATTFRSLCANKHQAV